MNRWHPLGQMVLARLREFYREPEAIFWVYCFPLLLAVVLGLAFAGRALTTGEDPPVARQAPLGCPFHDRCAHRRPLCLDTVPLLQEVAPEHTAACHRWREVVYS